MSVQRLFATPIYFAEALKSKEERGLLKRLLKDSYKIEQSDEWGQEWSASQYPGGYTSYSSISDLNLQNSDFMDLEKVINKHVRSFARNLEFDLDLSDLKMTSCWLNITREGGHHSMHLHPLSVISGTIYLDCPKDSGCLKFEDPRLSKFMAAPPKKDNATLKNQHYVEFEPKAGYVVLFESWLRHEVETNLSGKDRVSVSFNYGWDD